MREVLVQMSRGMGITGAINDWFMPIVALFHVVALTAILLLIIRFDKKSNGAVEWLIIKTSWLGVVAYSLLFTGIWLKI